MASSLDTAIAPGPAQAARPGVSLTDLLLLVTVIIWGANYSVVKYGTDRIDPLAYNGARVALASVVFAVIMLVRRPRIARRDVTVLLALGVLGNCVYQTLFAEGIAHTSAGSAALLLSASPALIAILGRWMGTEHIGARGYLGVTLSVAGIGLVVLGGIAKGGTATLGGNAIVVFAAVCWSVYTVLLKPITHRVSLIDVSALTLVGGCVPLLLGSLHPIVTTPWTHLPPLLWLAIVYSGVGSLVIGYLGWYRGVRVLGPTRTAVYSNLQPIVALLVSWPLLNEVPTAWQVAGAITIIAGVLLTRT